MSKTSALYGSYAQRFPEGVTAGIEIQKALFSPDFALPLVPFAQEPLAATARRLEVWKGFVSAKQKECPSLEVRDRDGLPALFEGEKPRMFAGPLYTLDNPVAPKCFYQTDWTYFQASQDPEYIERLEQAGVLPPLMAGMHLESPQIGLERRPSAVQGRPGENHPPSCSMREPSLHLTASKYLFTAERLGKLGFADFAEALENCQKIVLGQIHTYNPDQVAERPHLADYRFIFDGGIPLPIQV